MAEAECSSAGPKSVLRQYIAIRAFLQGIQAFRKTLAGAKALEGGGRARKRP